MKGNTCLTLGLVGRVGSGKDTVGSMIIKVLLNSRIMRLKKRSFAEPLKKFTQTVFDLDSANIHDQQYKEAPIEFVVTNQNLFHEFACSINDYVLDYLKPSSHFYNDVYDEILMNSGIIDSENTMDLLEVRCINYLYERFLDVLSTEYTNVEPKLMDKINYFFSGNPPVPAMKFKTSGRKLMQLLGTEFFRHHIRPNVWTEIADYHLGVFCDTRFKNEAEAIKSQLNGFTIRVINENQTVNSAHNTHISEVESDSIECDYTIYNPGDTLFVLEERVKVLLKEIGFDV